ncbi:MAG: di-trans,poly-cis-decaprenylcistransferase [Alphaproteobacteria bacterium]|nr:MAG: di-trans,poly-cis-decaprenylcistransferase [Alphaproteobacteria bacterium]
MHVAIVPDGNRRWARNNGKSIIQGYEQGIDVLKATVEEAIKLNIQHLTFFVLSKENAKRSADWVKNIKFIFKKFLTPMCEEAVRQGCEIRFIGDTKILGGDVDDLIQLAHKTPKETKLHLNFCLGYSGRSDIIQAVEKMIKVGAKPEEFPQFLSTVGLPDPEIVIRTSGEMRVSNFLLFESAYSEFFFIQKHWPDFTREDFHKVVEEFGQRERRFGL